MTLGLQRVTRLPHGVVNPGSPLLVLVVASMGFASGDSQSIFASLLSGEGVFIWEDIYTACVF